MVPPHPQRTVDLTARRGVGLAAVLAALLLTASCSPAPGPIRLGFIGSIKTFTGDHDRAGRDGAMLAVSEINAAGGIQGRPLELMVLDDEFSPAQAIDAVHELSRRGVAGIVGPMTSRMGAAVAAAAESERIVALSPAVSTETLSGQDDHFLRLYPQTHVGASALAESFARDGVRLAHVIRDVTNFAHTGEFTQRFFERFVALGGQNGEVVDFDPRQESSLSDVVQRLPVAGDGKEAVILLSTPSNVGLMAQVLRRRVDERLLGTSEWAASNSLIAMGGSAVEGLRVAKVYDDNESSGATGAFRAAFVAQFFYEPTFPAACSYEAVKAFAMVLGKATDREEVRAALLSSGPYHGLQGDYSFDRYGDVIRPMNVMVIKDAQFAPETPPGAAKE